ncbi:MAG: FG-GAP repeat protein [Flavobacteriales bacterium]
MEALLTSVINWLEGGFDFQTGTVNDPVVNSPSWSICAGDLDGNGFNDLLYASGSGASFIWANEKTGLPSKKRIAPNIFSANVRTWSISMQMECLMHFCLSNVDPNVYFLNTGDQNLQYYQVDSVTLQTVETMVQFGLTMTTTVIWTCLLLNVVEA